MTDEEIVDRMERDIPASSPEEAAKREEYQRLFARIRDQPDIPPPPGWEERAVARWQRRRLIVRAVVVLALIWAAAAIALLA